MSKKSIRTIIILSVLGIFAIIILATSIYTVKPNEYAVIRHLGKIETNNIFDEPGLRIKIPFIQSVQKITKETLLYDIPESDAITKDKKSMVVDCFVLWKITDPKANIRTLNAITGRAEERIEAAVYNAVKNTISSMTQDEIIASRGETLTNLITKESNSDIAQYGIEIITAQIKMLSIPSDNQTAVYDRMISERENIAAGYKATGEAEAQKIRNETDKQVELLLAEANKNAAIIIAEGEEEYMRILKDAYNSNDKAEFYLYLRSLDALKNSLINSEDNIIILDKDFELVKILMGTN